MAAAKTATGALYQALMADPDVATDMGGTSDPRLHIDVAPQDTVRPYGTLQTIQDSSVHHQGGVCALRDPLVQVDVWAETAEERDRLAEHFRARLDFLNGTQPDAHVRVVSLERVQNSAEPRNDGSGTYTFRWSADARVWYVPT